MSNHARRGQSARPARLPSRAAPAAAPPQPPAPDSPASPNITRIAAGIPEMGPEQEAAMAAAMQEARDREAADNVRRLLADPAALLARLPQIYGQALASMITQGVVQALQQVQALPVKPVGRLCATCLGQRIQWNTRHADAISRAQTLAMAQIGATDPGDPRLQQIDIIPLLPEPLRPGGGPDALPVMFDAVTTIQGTDLCPQHHPAAAGQAQPGKLIVMPGISVHAAAHLAMTGQPGMPGAPAAAG
jgi:hypothetical protein